MDQPDTKPIKTQRVTVFALVALTLAVIYLLVEKHLDSLEAAKNQEISAARAMVEKDLTRATLASDIRFHAEQSEVSLAALPFINDREKRIPVYKEMDKHNAALDQAIAHITPLLNSANEKEVLSRLVKVRETFRSNMQETVDAIELDDREKAALLLWLF